MWIHDAELTHARNIITADGKSAIHCKWSFTLSGRTEYRYSTFVIDHSSLDHMLPLVEFLDSVGISESEFKLNPSSYTGMVLDVYLDGSGSPSKFKTSGIYQSGRAYNLIKCGYYPLL